MKHSRGHGQSQPAAAPAPLTNGLRQARLLRFCRFLCVAPLLAALLSVTAFAAGGQTMWQVADTIIKDVYKQISAISTVLAGLMSAVAVIGAKMSNNQHKVDQSWDWLKRIWIAWTIINGIGAFIAYVRPFLAGLNTIS